MCIIFKNKPYPRGDLKEIYKLTNAIYDGESNKVVKWWEDVTDCRIREATQQDPPRT